MTVRHIALGLAVTVAVVLGIAAVAEAKRVHGIPVPGRAKAVRGKAADGVYTSRLSFRRTVRYYNRYLKARKIEHTAVPVYRYRGVLVARWIAKDTKRPWAAIHVFHRRGKTKIFIVPTRQPSKKP